MRKLEFVLILFLILLATPATLAQDKISVLVNGALLDSQSPPLKQNNRVIVPMRAIFEALGREVTWNSVDRSITSASLWMQIDNPQAVINGTRILLDVPPKLVMARLMFLSGWWQKVCKLLFHGTRKPRGWSLPGGRLQSPLRRSGLEIRQT